MHLIGTRKEYDFIFSNEKSIERKEEAKLFIEAESLINIETPPTQEETKSPPSGDLGGCLNTNNPYNLKYQGNEAMYQIKGFRVEQMDSLKITIQITAE